MLCYMRVTLTGSFSVTVSLDSGFFSLHKPSHKPRKPRANQIWMTSIQEAYAHHCNSPRYALNTSIYQQSSLKSTSWVGHRPNILVSYVLTKLWTWPHVGDLLKHVGLVHFTQVEPQKNCFTPLVRWPCLRLTESVMATSCYRSRVDLSCTKIKQGFFW